MSTEARPKIELEITQTDRALEVAGYAALAFLWIFTIYADSNLPETIPVHFSISGEINDYGSKMTLWILPVIGTLVFGLLTILNRIPSAFNYPVKITPENAERQYKNAIQMLRSLKLCIVLVMILAIYMIYTSAKNQSAKNTEWFLPVILILSFLGPIYFVVKAIKGK
ncbi:MAG: DUF1648 domain-containing protein [Saprospiraceae bacterium]